MNVDSRRFWEFEACTSFLYNEIRWAWFHSCESHDLLQELSSALADAQQNTTELEVALLQSNNLTTEQRQTIDRLTEEIKDAREKIKSLDREAARLGKEVATLEKKVPISWGFILGHCFIWNSLGVGKMVLFSSTTVYVMAIVPVPLVFPIIVLFSVFS